MVDEWSGLADLLATLIEKYMSVVLADDIEISSDKSSEENTNNSVDNDMVA